MQLSNFSALSRPVDISYRSNFSVLLISFFTLLAAFFYQWWYLDNEFGESIWWAVQAMLAVFLAWALGREIDPDIKASAFVAIPISFGLFLFAGSFQWWVLLAMLLLLRVGNHCTGKSVKWLDVIFCLGLCAYLCWQGHYLVGFAFCAAFLVDSRLPPANKLSQWYALAALLMAILSMIFFPAELSNNEFLFSGWWIAGVVLVLLIYLLAIREYKRPHSTEDYRVQPLNGQRVQSTQLIVLFFVLVIYLTQNFMASIELGAIWAVILSVDLLRFYQLLTRRSLY
ncbi:hypothetical protein [Catalinimonas alkaloidigena]|uniref:hypothetical protein n=1 Tax=Catalinimonas alkaloidigena TaxID=1075417 RepID=UPI002404D647|nr:hypothetical protein [Catalinimonas alkaloidigena]